jgi:hypothetical protein
MIEAHLMKKYFDTFKVLCLIHTGIKQGTITDLKQVQDLIKPVLPTEAV